MELLTFLRIALGIFILNVPSSAAKIYLCGDSTMQGYNTNDNRGGEMRIILSLGTIRN